MTPQDVISFWSDIGEKKWFPADLELDAEIRKRFEPQWRMARSGKLVDWKQSATGTLALLILLDQFPRNMFRGRAQAFSTDVQARDLARFALARGHDLAFQAALRAFFYLPFMHSEDLGDQDICVNLIAQRLGTSSVNYPFALRHRDIIVRFGRFPMRNVALGRQSSAAEKVFIAKVSPH